MTSDRLSTTFAALADPTRRAILSRLLTGERSVGELAGPFEMSMPAVSKHLRVLERAGLITQRKDAQWRLCRIEGAPLKEDSDWTDRYRRVWEERLDRLDQYVQQMKAKENASTQPAGGVVRGKETSAQLERGVVRVKEKTHGRKQRQK